MGIALLTQIPISKGRTRVDDSHITTITSSFQPEGWPQKFLLQLLLLDVLMSCVRNKKVKPGTSNKKQSTALMIHRVIVLLEAGSTWKYSAYHFLRFGTRIHIFFTCVQNIILWILGCTTVCNTIRLISHYLSMIIMVTTMMRASQH